MPNVAQYSDRGDGEVNILGWEIIMEVQYCPDLRVCRQTLGIKKPPVTEMVKETGFKLMQTKVFPDMRWFESKGPFIYKS